MNLPLLCAVKEGGKILSKKRMSGFLQGGVASAAISYDGEQQHPYPATRLEFMTKTHQSGSPQCF